MFVFCNNMLKIKKSNSKHLKEPGCPKNTRKTHIWDWPCGTQLTTDLSLVVSALAIKNAKFSESSASLHKYTVPQGVQG